MNYVINTPSKILLLLESTHYGLGATHGGRGIGHHLGDVMAGCLLSTQPLSNKPMIGTYKFLSMINLSFRNLTLYVLNFSEET